MCACAPSNTPHPLLEGAAWLRAPETQLILRMLTAEGGTARVVGGAVRNALLGRPVKDIDVATDVLPEDVMRLANGAGLQAIPTGLAHGTVTVIAGRTPYEVTTLRRDLGTDGRRATVAFTSDWVADAERRDFTINALYCDPAGRLFDFVDGLTDLDARRVRFIGRPEDRIEEDFLRILRFYRFTAEYGEGRIDAEGNAACMALQEGLERISAERIRAETVRLLVAPYALIALSEMDEAGILRRILGRSPDLMTFARLTAIEAAQGVAPEAMRRLYALAATTADAAGDLRDRLRLSKSEYEHLADLTLPDTAFMPEGDENRARIYLYRHGARAFRDGLLITWARDLKRPVDDAPSRERLALQERWPVPVLPVSGRDVIALGVPPGPDVGTILTMLEQWWAAAGFPADETLIRARLAAIVNLKEA